MDFRDENESVALCLDTGLPMNCALLIKDPTDPVDTAILSTDDIGGLLSTVLDELVNSDDDILPDIPIMPIELLEFGNELDGKDDGALRGVDTGGGPTTDDDGLPRGGFRPGKALDVAFIVGAGDIEREVTAETSLEISVEWFTSERKL